MNAIKQLSDEESLQLLELAARQKFSVIIDMINTLRKPVDTPLRGYPLGLEIDKRVKLHTAIKKYLNQTIA